MEGFIAGAWRQFLRSEIYLGGQWRRLTRVEGYVGGQWRTLARFVQPLSVSISPTSVYGFANPFKPSVQTVTSGTVVATPSGGLGPYSYAWSSGNSPTSAFNSFTATLAANTELDFAATLTVTDSLGSTANASVDVTLVNESQT
ncbi:MAG: hypothetical protein J7500_15820 [Sphingomonas sp.]|uniref:hypothetical protein n=1 Tax=Sphingomonas sp. TaxID=28214 RepID=UPI001B233541|nr:hypothetical protein [Sphingomonas sp.]MBO9624176.1 hypothetical protein [Sphingomonas sp.]